MAFDPPVDSVDGLTLRIEAPEVFDAGPVTVHVALESQGEAATGQVRLGVIEPWVAEPAGQSFSVPPGRNTRLEFTLRTTEPPYNALYPVHAYADVTGGATLHAVLVAEVHHENPPRPGAVPVNDTVLQAPSEGILPLWNAPNCRAAIDLNQEGGVETRLMPPGWQGSDGDTRATLQMNQRIDRGALEPSIAMHPPYYGGADGDIRAEISVDLPNTTPLKLTFRYAIRDNNAAADEPPSDGVTFRVRLADADAPLGTVGELQFEDHSGTKQWQEGEVDLSAFAGKPVRVQLEVDPGPKRDKTCDQAYWGRPQIVAGTPVEETSDSRPKDDGIRLGAVTQAEITYAIRVFPGERGLLDGYVCFSSARGELAFHGIEVDVAGDALHTPGGLWRLRNVRREAGTVDRWVHHFTRGDASLDLVVELQVDRGALQLGVRLENAPEDGPWRVTRIERAALGPWTSGVRQVYAGVGNVLEEPEAFTLHFDGHQLATAHVGADFNNGYALVQRVDTSPLRLETEPREKRFTLVAEDNTTFTLVPGGNVWMAARALRNMLEVKAGPGVPELAGRFVFDLWGGRYADSAARLEEAFALGLTNSAVIWHNWQRWGYDYRLPDILPPNPAFGTEEEFQTLIEVCRAHNVPFVLHDNYIDIYPDASDFGYDKVCMTEQNEPVRGWLNEYRQAQAYRWRPDAYQPALESNVSRLARDYAPTGYFVDVWASARPHGFWTAEGAYQNAAWTRDAWGESFDRIRMLLDGAPTISESGTDQLIGHLDGATANHLRVDPEPPGEPYFTWRVRAADAERVPWIDMVWHDRFALHGAGYENRYAAGLNLTNHGIYSDDYICTEILTGHPGMVKEPFSRDAVRKYWLADGVARALARVPMGWVTFVDDDIHRLYVHWENGGDVWVNRGGGDWQGKTHRLPPYGFYASIPREQPHTEAAIEYIDGVIAEWARTPEALYVNARPPDPRVAPVTFREAEIRQDGDELTLTLRWEADGHFDQDYRIFVHAVDEQGTIQFQGDHDPPLPTSAWKDAVETTAHMRLPQHIGPSETWSLRAGFYNPGSGERPRIRGAADGHTIALGALRAEGTRQVEYIAGFQHSDDTPTRENWERTVLDFGPVATNGACQLIPEDTGVVIVPLPGSEAFEIHLKRETALWTLSEPQSLVAQNEEGVAVPISTGPSGEIHLTIGARVGRIVLQ